MHPRLRSGAGGKAQPGVLSRVTADSTALALESELAQGSAKLSTTPFHRDRLFNGRCLYTLEGRLVPTSPGPGRGHPVGPLVTPVLTLTLVEASCSTV